MGRVRLKDAARIRNQRKVFRFLVARFRSQRAFSKENIESLTSWTGTSFPTYWSKQLSQFTIPAGGGRFRVSEAFRPYATWARYRQHVTQVRHVSSDYSCKQYDNVLVYDFFMPLTNEGHLRITLDALCYQDTILARLRTRNRTELESHFKRRRGESADKYLRRACRWISGFFVGYSISHVNGRFRAGRIASLDEAAQIQSGGGRYLIDETTAIVRFIFPCESQEQAETVEWFFHALFVESILQVVNGEDAIWMIESGLRNRLHIWRVEEA
jgi:hypothetical protein